MSDNYTKQMDKIVKKKRKKAESSKYGPYNDAALNSDLAKALKAKKVMEYSNSTYSPSEQKWGKKK